MRLPKLNQETGGYFVFFTLLLADGVASSTNVSKHWLPVGSWKRIHNSYGWTWSIKGFAINAAKKTVKWYSPDPHVGEIHTCVVDAKTKQLVWKSWNEEEHSYFSCY